MPEEARRAQERPGEARRGQKRPGEARRGQEAGEEGPRRGQERPGEGRSSWCFHVFVTVCRYATNGKSYGVSAAKGAPTRGYECPGEAQERPDAHRVFMFSLGFTLCCELQIIRSIWSQGGPNSKRHNLQEARSFMYSVVFFMFLCFFGRCAPNGKS